MNSAHQWRYARAVAAFLVAGMSWAAMAEEGGAAEALRMNHVQVVGTHNSYHMAPNAILRYVVGLIRDEPATWDYTHAPLDVQLERGVRSVELDVYADAGGTRVMHVPVFDSRSTCSRFVDCLGVICDWSRAHPGHVPVSVLVELKHGDVPFIPVTDFDEAALDVLDDEIRSVFDEEHLLTPDDVRGDAPTLAQAVEEKGWPLLSEARGKVMLILHTRGVYAEMYTKDRPLLQGRAMFLESQEGEPYAAVFIRNNPDDESITALAERNYIIRTRGDADILRALEGETSRRDAALASAAHIISTDFPPGEAAPGNGYCVSLPGGVPARCNAHTAPSACKDADLEAR